MTDHHCTGLDGSNPLHALAACGVLAALDDAGVAARMYWHRQERWYPVFSVDCDRDSLCRRLAEVFLPADVIARQQASDSAQAALTAVELRVDTASVAVQALGKPTDAAGKAALKAAKAAEKTAKEARSAAKASVAGADASAICTSAVQHQHPVTAVAQHLDNIDKGGLSVDAFRQLAPGASYLPGLAVTVELKVKVKGGMKTMIARSAFSFSNNNSGKALLKDFAGVARYATPERIADALFGDGQCTDPITGLGWDPASQRSYALQFADPQDLVECQTMHHALAFYGLSCFPVMPTARDRLTTGFITTRSTGPAADADDEEQGDEPTTGKRIEWFQWPIWTAPLSARAVRGVLAMADVAATEPDLRALAARGIAALYRARRFSLNKRSYFAPGVPA